MPHLSGLGTGASGATRPEAGPDRREDRPLLDVRDLEVSYAGAVRGLRGVSVPVPDGTVVAVLGSNGAGKSTLLRAVSGTLALQGGTIDAGSVEFAGRPLRGMDPAKIVRAGVVQVPEGRQIFGELTVEENLRAGGLPAPRGARAQARTRVFDLFPILRDRRAQPAGLLSGGEQQMLAIGRALMAGPRLLLLDEPSLGLAPRMVEQIGEVIAEIKRQGTAVVLVEQNAALALGLADLAYVLEVGRVTLHGRADELAATEEVRDRYLGVGEQRPGAAEGAAAEDAGARRDTEGGRDASGQHTVLPDRHAAPLAAAATADAPTPAAAATADAATPAAAGERATAEEAEEVEDGEPPAPAAPGTDAATPVPGRGGPRPLVVEGLSVRFGGVAALSEVSFTVRPGSIHALIGPNGAGKSTCLNVLTGVYTPSAGSVSFGDQVLTRLPPHRIARLGVSRTFQNIALSPGATVADNLLLGRHRLTRAGFVTAGLRLPRARREQARQELRVREIATLLELDDQLDRPIGQLAYGDRKRVEVARALCAEPALLLLDEPVAGMNAGESRQMARVVQLARAELGITIVLVEHDMGFVMGIADRVTVLDFGRRIAEGPPAEVQRDPEVLRAYLGTSADSTTPAAGGATTPTAGGNGTETGGGPA